MLFPGVGYGRNTKLLSSAGFMILILESSFNAEIVHRDRNTIIIA